MAWANNLGKPIFRVRFSRTDEPGIDETCLSAWSKAEAEAGIRRMYKARLSEIRSVARMRETRHH